MFTKILVAAIALPSIVTAIELKPTLIETDIEQGIKVSEIALPDGPKQILYAYPVGWRSKTGADELTYTHPEFLHTSLAIRLAKTATLGEEEIKARKEWITSFAPKGATEFTVEKAQQSDLVVNNFPILDIAASYVAFGQKYKIEVFVLYASTGTMEFIVISPEKTFEKAFERVRQSMFSLRWQNPAAVKSTAAK